MPPLTMTPHTRQLVLVCLFLLSQTRSVQAAFDRKVFLRRQLMDIFTNTTLANTIPSQRTTDAEQLVVATEQEIVYCQYESHTHWDFLHCIDRFLQEQQQHQESQSTTSEPSKPVSITDNLRQQVQWTLRGTSYAVSKCISYAQYHQQSPSIAIPETPSSWTTSQHDWLEALVEDCVVVATTQSQFVDLVASKLLKACRQQVLTRSHAMWIKQIVKIQSHVLYNVDDNTTSSDTLPHDLPRIHVNVQNNS